MQKNEYTIAWTVCVYNDLTADDMLLIEDAKKYAENAYAPYSQFKVGAAVRLANGVVVGGSNQENAAYPSGLCAERVALFSAASQYPDVAPVQMAIIALVDGKVIETPLSPCGGCRQLFVEMEQRYCKPFELLLCGRYKALKISSTDLMPLAFGSEFLSGE